MSNKKFLIVDILFFIVAAYLVVDCLIEGDVTGVVFGMFLTIAMGIIVIDRFNNINQKRKGGK
ncbi:hypothetical protein [Macrococcoides caseolyticum]|uniref:Uncharacterized protein n=1 Tax=Macrococcoides caseolyticum TaxID=69966 RepID=A0ACC9MUS8_9STAP|nr:hypothetical protein [Macrococcus caseolyticus]PKE47243.1 hypothetical protein CW677_08685 [Macrococcus caseolyticus]PKE57276.1 hypothetical protein CW682_01305 [Macrococcus caseolyticus]PKF28967.1 hypothetical protein CW697_10510 [Macrococcus caseolyticus]QYA35962.1 hypothetical protein KYI08_03555 [Macrococcus caseolyticus]TDM23328.1 hypothetical protein ETI01_07955 [Macrococcus caseolyticus]